MHTPEPWKVNVIRIVNGHEQRVDARVVDKKGDGIATVFNLNGDARRHTNARLIALAPEMKIMLEGAIGILEAREAVSPAEILLKHLIRHILREIDNPMSLPGSDSFEILPHDGAGPCPPSPPASSVDDDRQAGSERDTAGTSKSGGVWA